MCGVIIELYHLSLLAMCVCCLNMCICHVPTQICIHAFCVHVLDDINCTIYE